MRFKPGDLVIKITGGNKMRIVDYTDDTTVDCVWATEEIHEGKFNEDDLVDLSEYKNSILVTEKRDVLINSILNEIRNPL
jgi:uncharacterized protein YodC (DUF2158 family)